LALARSNSQQPPRMQRDARVRWHPGPLRSVQGILILLLATAWGAAADPSGFLLLTTPHNAKIAWVKLPESGDFAGLTPSVLIDTGLQHPQGIAVDKKRKRLYVADPDAQKIYGYQLTVVNNGLATDGKQVAICSGIESRWVSVDGSGNVFFSDEPRNQILKVPAEKVLRGEAEAQTVYSGEGVAQVSEPGGVAVDNFHVFWTNKHFGTEVGVLVRGSESPPSATDASSLSVLAKNSVKCYGVCIAMGNVFFTDSEKALYGVKKNGGPVAEITASLDKPRGCAWDGDGTVYVADRGAGAVYSFASNMHVISKTEVKRVFEFEDAFGLAVLTSAANTRGAASLLLQILLAAAAAAAALLG